MHLYGGSGGEGTPQVSEFIKNSRKIKGNLQFLKIFMNYESYFGSQI